MKSRESFLSQIKRTIEVRADAMKEALPLLKYTKSGDLLPEELAQYLFNLKYLFKQNQKYLEDAVRESKTRCFENLYQFLLEKTEEERDHDVWADRDLSALNSQVKQNVFVTDESIRMIQSTREMIDIDPRLYLAYILATEYITIYLGPEQLQDAERACGITQDQLTAISYHVQADQGHVKDDLRAIAELIESKMERSFLGALQFFLNRIDETLRSLVHERDQAKDPRDVRFSRGPERNLS